MLVSQRMGSNGGHNLPFGYDPNGVHGIGLPNFSVPGAPPPGPGILSDQEQEQIQDFFNGFDSTMHGSNVMLQFAQDMPQMHDMQMPQQYVGHETSLRSSHSWQDSHMGGFHFNGQMNNMQSMTPHTPTFSPNHAQHPAQNINGMFGGNAVFAPMNHGWQPQQSHQYSHHQMPIRPDMNFGTDPNFQNGSYHGPSLPTESGMSLADYNLEIQSTAPNTRSNTNTEPSSPVISKKRKHSDFDAGVLRNGLKMTPITQKPATNNATTTSRKRKSFVKHERPPTPLSKPGSASGEVGLEPDALYDDDDAEAESDDSASSPAPWPQSKAPPAKKERTVVPEKAKKRRKSEAESTKAKSRSSRVSGANQTSSRTPLTADQKKANHTNSEQRRRDATARAYAELYDLVPEVNEMGKQSTMKKLELVVDKVRKVKTRVEELRAQLGVTGPIQRRIPSVSDPVAHHATGQMGQW